jgi:hypothetical protein
VRELVKGHAFVPRSADRRRTTRTGNTDSVWGDKFQPTINVRRWTTCALRPMTTFRRTHRHGRPPGLPTLAGSAEESQHTSGEGSCMTAPETSQIVTVTRAEQRWPHYFRNPDTHANRSLQSVPFVKPAQPEQL